MAVHHEDISLEQLRTPGVRQKRDRRLSEGCSGVEVGHLATLPVEVSAQFITRDIEDPQPGLVVADVEKIAFHPKVVGSGFRDLVEGHLAGIADVAHVDHVNPAAWKRRLRGGAVLQREDLVPDEDTVITVTTGGYVKRLPITSYRIQRRGGKGVIGMTTKEEDAVDALLAYLSSRGAVDDRLADQLLVFLALARADSVFTCSTLSAHLRTVGEVVRQFVPVRIALEGGSPAKVWIRRPG